MSDWLVLMSQASVAMVEEEDRALNCWLVMMAHAIVAFVEDRETVDLDGLLSVLDSINQTNYG